MEEAVQDLDEYIQGLEDDVFKGKASPKKGALGNMFSAVQDKLEQDEFVGAVNQLHGIRGKADGLGVDWIKDSVAQGHICGKIDDIVAYIETL